MLVLGIESSCDETAAAVVADGRRVLSNQVASQVPLHQRYGGVVPEIASRAHLEQIDVIVRQALSEAGVTLEQIDAVAVTRGPGLIGCLLVGVEFAKALAIARGIPIVYLQHIGGHLYSPYLGREKDAWGVPVDTPSDHSPYIGLCVSGGHSSLVLVNPPFGLRPLGETLDDAVGEAYDKVAKLMGLGYPGGPLVDQRAAGGDPKRFQFPRPLRSREDCNFSFSGLKTSVARKVEELGGAPALKKDEQLLADLCAGFQAACIDVLLSKTKRALKETGTRRLAVVGGVASNRGLRAAMQERFNRIAIALPDPEYCTDNAAMIAGLGFHLVTEGLSGSASINASSSLALSPAGAAWQLPVKGKKR